MQTTIVHQHPWKEKLSLEKLNNVIWLSILGLADFIVITLYQTGVIKHLPDLPWEVFNSDKVNGSEDAIIFGIPDGFFGGATYVFIILMCLIEKSDTNSAIPKALLMFAIVGNVCGALFYLYTMIFVQHLACIYCIFGAIINFISLAVIFPWMLRVLKGTVD